MGTLTVPFEKFDLRAAIKGCIDPAREAQYFRAEIAAALAERMAT